MKPQNSSAELKQFRRTLKHKASHCTMTTNNDAKIQKAPRKQEVGSVHTVLEELSSIPKSRHGVCFCNPNPPPQQGARNRLTGQPSQISNLLTQ